MKYFFDPETGLMHFTMPPGIAFKLLLALETSTEPEQGRLCPKTFNAFVELLATADERHKYLYGVSKT